MKLNKKTKILVGVILFFLYSIALVKISSNPTSLISTKTNDKYLARFIENYNLLKENWYYFKGEEKVIDAATQAMTSSDLSDDKYTQYIESDQSAAYFESMESSYVGIGIQYFSNGEYPLVIKVYDDSPAAKAKLKVGDTITEVDGKSIKGKNSDEIKSLVVGKDGTKVNLTVQRADKKLNISATRAKLDSSISYKKYGNTGYVNINEFSKTTDVEMKKALTYMEKEKVNKLIIDLRNNPGGYLDTLERTTDLFMTKNQIILKTKDKNNDILEYKTVDDYAYKNNIILLVNKNTASAAEAFTASMNENLNVAVYGETTFGKGIMQNFFEYPDKSYLKYTNAEWLTPKGNSINKKGIKPTKEISKGAIYNAADLSYSLEKDIKNNTVEPNLISYQKALKALGYNVDRTDGYYSPKTRDAINKFKKDKGLLKEKDLSKTVQSKIVETIFISINNNKNDKVLQAALA